MRDLLGRIEWLPVSVFALVLGVLLATGFLTRFNGVPQLGVPSSCGSFGPPPQVEFVEDGDGKGRDMRLLRDFVYTDARGGVWTAQKGDITDGASIPAELWTLVGGPYEGSYRLGAIIHDQYMYDPAVRWQDAHRIFFYANCAAGVDAILNKKLYGGVMLGGPKWGSGPSNCETSCHSVVADKIAYQPELRDGDMANLLEWIEQTDPTLDEIDQQVGADTPLNPHRSVTFNVPGE